MRLLFILLFITVSCESYDSKSEACTVQGFDELSDTSIQSTDKLRVSHVAYSTAEHVRIINGKITISQESFPFTIVLDDQKFPKVITSSFPFASMDSLAYRCSFQMKDGGFCEILWERENKRVYLRKRVTL